jgi:hypothetical protein
LLDLQADLVDPPLNCVIFVKLRAPAGAALSACASRSQPSGFSMVGADLSSSTISCPLMRRLISSSSPDLVISIRSRGSLVEGRWPCPAESDRNIPGAEVAAAMMAASVMRAVMWRSFSRADRDGIST